MRWLSDEAVGRLRSAIELPDLSATDYCVLHKLGAGGMGTVYVAQDRKLNRQVALR